ncbi:G-type lectin S-receptor-like Serine/Threonine-kinase [Rhynchospora pubera]|uniref:G-type lectin S-receptor-like Serine/Threonine-kinase n=1 Tax=Rhynchospora pubera TaxID=906938 RepID=A0AAV8DF47_9POAL|nr:G-type lectin S-receptor-like Serine/Threonine-kinase [Rhynchospora pubera]
MIWSTPGFNCANPNTCGPYALCYDKGTSFACECPYGFSNISSIDTVTGSNSSAGSAGCVRNISWNCGAHFSHDSKHFSFYLLQNLVKLPANSQYLGVRSKEECESACLNNCSCTAYASGIGCNLWHGELINIVVRDDGLSGESLYIRIVVSNSKANSYRFIIGGVVVALFIFIRIVQLLWIFRGYLLFFKRDNNNDQLSIYSYTHIKHVTGNFSMKIGEGGFGSVFKGRLSNHTEIAVKKLKAIGVEEKQFRIEVQTIGMIRHANLVRLLGFCAEGNRRILVYEYMSKGSLDAHLFTEFSNILSWQERFKIAIGIARGLTYLHEECRDCIIHCDIKPENVLLDKHFSPKISDFGMAKLLGREFSRALTTIRGTVGYLAPEWYSGEAITQRADVYSFGMMLFEIISGRRNSSEFNNRRYPYFPLYATAKMNEGEVLCLLDEKLGGNVNVSELIRACKVAGWCIQEPEACRPSMKKVALMLQGIISVGIPPVPRSLLNLVDADDY